MISKKILDRAQLNITNSLLDEVNNDFLNQAESLGSINFLNCILRRCTFIYTNFESMSFQESLISSCTFTNSNFTNCKLPKVIYDCSFKNCILDGVEGITFVNCNLHGCKGLNQKNITINCQF